MMLEPMASAYFVRWLLLWSVRDGADRIVFRPSNDEFCQMLMWIAGEQHEIVPPSVDTLQALPKELARLQPAGWFWRIASFFHRPREGHFNYRIGSGSVPVIFHVQWQAGRLAELTITLGLAPKLAKAAEATLQAMLHPASDEFD